MIFGIRGNITRDEFPAIAHKLIKSLEKKSVHFIVESGTARLLNKQFKLKLDSDLVASPKTLIKKSDFIVSIGGDGTFLETAKLVNIRNVPIIGVNMGKLGYLAETSINKVSDFISDILKNKYIQEERSVLSATCNVTSKEIHGMNEIVINQNGLVKTIFLEIYYNNSLVISYHADGLIVSTPTGSTAYSLSAGGPIVSPGTNVVIICPICPHTFTARPIILPDDGKIRVNIKNTAQIAVTSDGNNSFRLNRHASVIIQKAPYSIKVVKPLDSNYFKILNQKLLWGEDKRINR